jgi:precorrin-6Y C5,15-methyltransferase (decarboxylating)
MDREKIVILGMGLSDQDLTASHLESIRSADLLVGGQRHLAPFQDLPMEKCTIGGDLEEILTLLRAQPPQRRVVVLASGDPLLFGIGGRLVRELGADQVHVVPNVSSMAAAFARLGEPWEASALVSLHGREETGPLAAALRTRVLTAVLTDGRRTPSWLAGWLMEKGADYARLAVFERLGTPQERWRWYSPVQAAEMVFETPNLVVIKVDDPAAYPRPLRLGLDDETYAHEEGLITKSEVRAVVLAKLALGPGLTLWDLGAGSGAVGIEAALFIGPGRIAAVEAKPGRAVQIRENARRFGVYNLEVFEARLPDGMEALPPPDRIFIGGGGRDLPAIIARAAERLAPEGVMVVNTVLLDNLAPALAALENAGLAVEVVQIQIGRSKPMPWSLRLAAENPVWIIRGSRK